MRTFLVPSLILSLCLSLSLCLPLSKLCARLLLASKKLTDSTHTAGISFFCVKFTLSAIKTVGLLCATYEVLSTRLWRRAVCVRVLSLHLFWTSASLHLSLCAGAIAAEEGGHNSSIFVVPCQDNIFTPFNTPHFPRVVFTSSHHKLPRWMYVHQQAPGYDTICRDKDHKTQ